MAFVRDALRNLTLSRAAPILVTVLYIGGAALYFSSVGNSEFLGYIAIIALLVLFGGCVLAHQCVPAWLFWLLSSVGLLHVLGAGVMVGGDVLYNHVPFPIENPTGLTFIKFDQIVHLYGSAVASALAYFFVRRDSSFRRIGLFVFAALASMGIGAINEVIEFAAKMNVAESNVGGYYNTAVDLTVNLLGAVLGAGLAVLFWGRPAGRMISSKKEV